MEKNTEQAQYLDEVYSKLTLLNPSFAKKVPIDTFREWSKKPKYSEKVFNKLTKINPNFSEGISFDEFHSRLNNAPKAEELSTKLDIRVPFTSLQVREFTEPVKTETPEVKMPALEEAAYIKSGFDLESGMPRAAMDPSKSGSIYESMLELTPEEIQKQGQSSIAAIEDYYDAKISAVDFELQKTVKIVPKQRRVTVKTDYVQQNKLLEEKEKLEREKRNKAEEINGDVFNLYLAKQSPEFTQEYKERDFTRDEIIDNAALIGIASEAPSVPSYTQTQLKRYTDRKAKYSAYSMDDQEYSKAVLRGADVKIALVGTEKDKLNQDLETVLGNIESIDKSVSEIEKIFAENPKLREIPENKELYAQLLEDRQANEQDVSRLSEELKRTLDYEVQLQVVRNTEGKAQLEFDKMSDELNKSFEKQRKTPIGAAKFLSQASIETVKRVGEVGANLMQDILYPMPESMKEARALQQAASTKTLRKLLNIPEEGFEGKMQILSEGIERDKEGKIKDIYWDFNPAAIIPQAIKIYLESRFMGVGGAAATRGFQAVRPLSNLVNSRNAAARLFGKLLGKTAQGVGMLPASYALFSQQIFEEEFKKTGDYDLAKNLTLARVALEAATESYSPTEINQFLSPEKQLKELTDKQALDLATRVFGDSKYAKLTKFLYKGGEGVKQFVKEYPGLSRNEYLEEAMANVGNFMIDKTAHKIDPNYRQDNDLSLENEFLTAVNTVLSMPIMGIVQAKGAYQSAYNSARYLVGKSPELFKTNLKTLLNTKKITQEEYNLRLKEVEKAANSYSFSQVDFQDIDKTLDETKKLEGLDESYKEDILDKINTFADNSKFTIFLNNQQILENSDKMTTLIAESKGAPEKATAQINKLGDEMIQLRQENAEITKNTKLLAENLIDASFKLSQDEKLQEEMRVSDISKLLKEHYNLIDLLKEQDVETLKDKKQILADEIEEEKSRQNPNRNLLKTYSKILPLIDSRIEHLTKKQPETSVEPKEEKPGFASSEEMKEAFGEVLPQEEKQQPPTTPQPETKPKEEEERHQDTITPEELITEAFDADIDFGDVPVVNWGIFTRDYDDKPIPPQVYVTIGENDYTLDEINQVPVKYRDTVKSELQRLQDLLDEKLNVQSQFVPELKQIAKEEKKEQPLTPLSENPEDITRENEQNTFNLTRASAGKFQKGLTYLGMKLLNAYRSVATLSRDYVTARYVSRTGGREEILDETNEYAEGYNLDILSPNLLKEGDVLVFRLLPKTDPEYDRYISESLEMFSELSKEELDYINPADIDDLDYFIPIEILDENNKRVGFLHSLDYVRPNRVVETATLPDGQVVNVIEENYRELKNVRKRAIDLLQKNDTVKTRIRDKSAGHLFLDNTLEFRPFSEVFKSKNTISTLTILNTDMVYNGKQVNTIGIRRGRPVVVVTAPNGEPTAIGLKRTAITDEVITSILVVLDLYLDMMHKQTIPAVVDKIVKDYGVDLATPQGIKQYLSTFVDVSQNVDTYINGVNREELSKVPFIYHDVNDNTLYFSLERAFFEDTSKIISKGVKQLAEIGVYRINLNTYDYQNYQKLIDELSKVLAMKSLNIDMAKMEERKGKFEIPILELSEETEEVIIKEAPEFINKGDTYKDFVISHLSSNVVEHKLPNGEYSYFVSPTIEFDETFGESEQLEESSENANITPSETESFSEERDEDDDLYSLPKITSRPSTQVNTLPKIKDCE